MMSVFRPTAVSHLEQPMFLGEGVDVARYDDMKYPWIDKFTERQLSFFWRPEEIDLTKDKHDFNKLTEAEQHMFTSNLKYQILLDSVQGRSPNLAFLPIVSLPELETWIETWAFSETIHSRSYTHIIRNVYPNPSEVLDQITSIEEILERAASVGEEYDLLIKMNQTPEIGPIRCMSQIYRTLFSVYALESVRFYVSFACSFSFNERSLMEGNSKIITLIARDESLHMSAVQHILTTLANGSEGELWASVANGNSTWIKTTMDAVIKQETAWAEYLFSRGPVLGLNAEILTQYIRYIADIRMKAIGVVTNYSGDKKKNPIPWINKYLNSDTVQVAPQETEISSYLTGAVDSTIDSSLFGGMSL
jgi:ribonucleoside-diphosphate reductase beta chain